MLFDNFGDFGDFMGFERNFLGFLRIFWDFVALFGNLEDFEHFVEVFLDFGDNSKGNFEGSMIFVMNL